MSSKNWGGKRRGAGRLRQRLTLNKDAAKTLYLLVKLERSARSKPELTEECIVEEMIEARWQEINAEFERGAEIAQEPYIL